MAVRQKFLVLGNSTYTCSGKWPITIMFSWIYQSNTCPIPFTKIHTFYRFPEWWRRL